MSSKPTSPSRPASIPYGEVVSPNIRCDSPTELDRARPPTTPPYSPGSPPYSPGSPSYTAEADRQSSITITEAVHIPRWATGFVLGGRDNKHLYNIFRRHDDIVDLVGETCCHTFRNGHKVTVVTLIANGTKDAVLGAMRDVKRDIIGTIKKAKDMKRDGSWKDNRRDDRRSNIRHREDRRYRDDRRSESRYREDRRYQGDRRYRDDRRYQDDRRYREDRRYQDDRR